MHSLGVQSSPGTYFVQAASFVVKCCRTNISATASHKAHTHGPGWRTAHASSIDDKDSIVYP